MLRWKTIHHIPLDFITDRKSITLIKSAVIHNNFWLVLSCYDRLEKRWKHQMAVFNTRSLQTIKLDFRLPELGYIIDVISHLDQLYIITNLTRFEASIYQFDTKTMVFSKFPIFFAKVEGRICIKGSFLYVLEHIDNNRADLSLLKINLSDKTIERILLKRSPSLPVCDSSYQILFDYDEFYLLTEENNARKVFYFDKDEECPLLKFSTAAEPSNMRWIDDFVITTPYQHFPNGQQVLEAIDYEREKWITAPIESLETFSWWISSQRYDNKIFGIFAYTNPSKPNSKSYAIKTLEVKPTLTEICFLQLVDELLREKNRKKVKSVLEALPLSMMGTFRLQFPPNFVSNK